MRFLWTLFGSSRSFCVHVSGWFAAWVTQLNDSCSFFLASSPQVGCPWRSSLRVPRVTRPLSDCCSRIREALVSCEDAGAGRHMVFQVYVLWSWSASRLQQTHLFKFNTLFTWKHVSFSSVALPLWMLTCLDEMPCLKCFPTLLLTSFYISHQCHITFTITGWRAHNMYEDFNHVRITTPQIILVELNTAKWLIVFLDSDKFCSSSVLHAIFHTPVLILWLF